MKVGIVGLGMAGLRAAMLLERAGHEVVGFEARDRPGGRIHTAEPEPGVLYEAGGEWIDADHHRCLALLREFGLEAAMAGNWPKRLVHHGRWTTDDLVWNEALEDDLRVEAAAREICRGLRLPAWENLQSQEFDDVTLADFVRQNTMSERGRWWVNAKLRSDEGDDLDKIGLLGWLAGYMLYLDREGDEMSAYRFPGGAESLCRRMAEGLKGEMHYGKVLERVRQDGDGVRLTFEDGGEARVDRVVVTLPPRPLERIVFEPALGVGKRCAVEGCGMGRSVKIAWQFDRAWWKDEEWGGAMLCDGPLQQTWDGSMGEGAVLMAYINGDEAARWAALGDPVAAGLYELSLLSPRAKEHFQRGWFHDWIGDPYSRGGFSHLAPGYVLEHMASIAPPETRVHFAGEHASRWVGFIEGALESAERVADEIARS